MDTQANADNSTEPQAPPLDPSRRRFAQRVTITMGGLVATLVAIPALGMFLGPWLQRSPSPWRPVGPVDKFKEGETVQVEIEENSTIPWTGVTGLGAAWLRREAAEQFTAFAVNCSHLGCPVRWEAGAGLFLCPCHGGAYYADGSVAAGPPPHSLTQYPVRVKDGQVEIQAVGLPIK